MCLLAEKPTVTVLSVHPAYVQDVEKCMSGQSDYNFDIAEYAKERKRTDAIRQKGLLH